MRTKSKQDEEKIRRCIIRHSLTRALTVLHVYANNLRYRMMMVMIHTLRRQSRAGVESLLKCVFQGQHAHVTPFDQSIRYFMYMVTSATH